MYIHSYIYMNSYIHMNLMDNVLNFEILVGLFSLAEYVICL